jgi:hypothetical protein
VQNEATDTTAFYMAGGVTAVLQYWPMGVCVIKIILFQWGLFLENLVE